ncbi:putative lipase atg15 [Coemansia sp. RSA 988]|nr:putative lipase atg15 [Coemansia sp. RSA 988]
MGQPEAVTTLKAQRTTSERLWLVCRLVVGCAMLAGVARYVGGPIEMGPERPGHAPESRHTPLLSLRDVYVQSTPQPPGALVALSAQGTEAGRIALRAWYDDQAALARPRGYSFPFRLARWTRHADVAEAAVGDPYLTAQHAIALAKNSGGSSGMAQAAAEPVSNDTNGVVAGGTSRMLHSARTQYLRGEHARQHSYWRDAARDGKWAYYEDDGLRVPNITHKPTLVQLARMVANAYQPVESETWEQLGDRWDAHDSFGWEKDGLRGHVFADADNSTVVLALKGTSSTFFLGGGSETSTRDKFNDNRLFSCCCAYVDFTWSTVCDCHMSGSQCNATCLRNELNDEVADNYFFTASQIFMDVATRYPNADIVFAGHSLGGALASLLGLTFGLPAVAFEAPGDRLAARRLHLPLPPAASTDNLPLFHIGHTADPVFMGICAGRTSSCYYAGYALESRCHIGRQLVFDSVAQFNWRIDIRHHRMKEVIYLVLEPWGNTDPSTPFPNLEPEDRECVDCGLWKFVDEDSPQ